MRHCVGGFVLAGVVAVAFSAGLRAQTTQQPQSAMPGAASSPAPAHDLSGVWNMHATPAERKFVLSTYTAVEPELTPWGMEKYMSAKPSNGPRTHPLNETDDPVLKSCLPPGTPRIYLQPFPFRIVQTPREIIMIYEYDHTVRQIFMDGRKHPDDVIPTYMGHSIGKWEGDTLVVDTVGFNDKSWLDRDGHPHSDQLHVIERFHRVDHDNLQIGITMEDPKVLVHPWVTQLHFQLKPTWDIMEQNCADNASFLGFEK
jgi:hypothetical protein